MRHITQYAALSAALTCGGVACSDRGPSMPLRPEVPLAASASVNGGAPAPVEADVVQSGLCAFDVRMQVSGKGKVVIAGKDQSITLFTAPALEVLLTNVAEPEKQATVGITGAFHVTMDASGNSVYVITGRNLVHSPAFGLVLTRGLYTYSLDPDGNAVQPLSGRGQTTDLCALLS